ncbi:hypothetical protein P4O66_005284, partial [Electrophorus voltai]
YLRMLKMHEELFTPSSRVTFSILNHFLKLESIFAKSNFLLQNTTEYEERKLIRAAIRRLRAKEIQGALERIQLTGRHVEQPQNPQRRINVEDTQRENVDRTERIDKLQNQTRHKEALATGSNSDMVLVLDPLLRESVSCPLPICAGSPPSDALPTYKDCSDSAESDQSGGSLHCGCLNSSALAPCHGSCICSTLVSDISERGTSQKWAAGAEPGGGSSPGTNLGAGGNAHGSGKAVDLHSTTTAVTETQDKEVNGTTPASTLNLEPNCPRGRPKGRALKHREVTLGIDTLLFPLNKDAVFTNRPTSCQPLSQVGSVPDSVCKFTEPLETLVQRRNEQHSIQSPDTSSHCSPLLPSSCLAASTARGGGHGNDSPAQSQACADQSLGVVGGSQNAAENVRRSSCSSDEGQAPEGEASSGIADTHRDPLASMKTFLTIEIKDGRTASQQSPLSSSTAGTVMPRILSGPGGQRSGRYFTVTCRLNTKIPVNLTMPGVNLDLVSALEDKVASLGSPSGECAECGLEAVIGDLLVESVVDEDPDENLDNTEEGVSRLELTLQCAVQEIHCDLKAFGKYVDVRLEEATAKVNPAIEAIATLQEENLRLRLQQEKLARQIEALCQALGLPEDQPSQDQDIIIVPLEPSADPVPHPPTFSTRRSSSTPSLISSFSRSNSMPRQSEKSNCTGGPVDFSAVIFQVLPKQSAHSVPAPLQMEESAFTVASAVQMASDAPAVPNGSSLAQLKSEAASSSSGSKLTSEQLEAIQDEEILDKMLDDSKDFEERKMIRAAMRELRKKKRDQREKEREVRLQELRQQREERAQKDRSGAGEVVVRKVEKSVDGSTVSEITKTNRFAQSDEGSRMSRSTITETTYTQKSDRGTMQTKSYSYSSSSSTKKVGSVFDREDDSALERRQAERRKELVRAQTLPKTSAVQARRAMMEKLDKDSGSSPAQVNKVHRSTSFGVPNANSIKQMLLDWCRAKTRDYENVDIQNFSSSWSDGMAFCALVHNFFPEAFDYSALSPSNRRQNFEVAFKTAEKLADCPQLLDVDDMVRLREPDWKCVYTYLQEFYRGLVQKGLVKTKHST